MEDILSKLCSIAEFYNDMAIDDSCIGVFDTEKCLVYVPGKTIDYGMRAGDPIKPGGLTHRALTSKKRQVDFIPREVYGVPAVGVGFPIMINGEVIGCVSTGMTTEKQNELQSAAEKLSSSMEQMSATAQELSASSSEVMTLMNTVKSRSGTLLENFAKISDVNRVIKNVADETKLISINAKIESARLGEQGRAFGIVADAISNLAERTNESLATITKAIEDAMSVVGQVASDVNSAAEVSSEQLLGIDELTKMSMQLAEEAEHLQHMAQLKRDA